MRAPYMLLAPFGGALLLFWLVPVLQGLALGFGGEEFSLRAYRLLLDDSRYHRALANTSLYAIATIVSTVTLAVFFAHLIRGAFARIRSAVAFALLLPALTPPAVLAILFYLLFAGRHGLLNNALLVPLGLPKVDWLNDPQWILPALVILGVWRWAGLITFFVLAGLEAIPKAYEEMAEVDGASRWNVFTRVTMPLLRPVLSFCVVFLLVDAFSMFIGAYVLLGSSGGPLDAGLLLVSYVQQLNFAPYHDPARAAAVGFSIVPLLTVVVWWFLFRRTDSTKGTA